MFFCLFIYFHIIEYIRLIYLIVINWIKGTRQCRILWHGGLVIGNGSMADQRILWGDHSWILSSSLEGMIREAHITFFALFFLNCLSYNMLYQHSILPEWAMTAVNYFWYLFLDIFQYVARTWYISLFDICG